MTGERPKGYGLSPRRLLSHLNRSVFRRVCPLFLPGLSYPQVAGNALGRVGMVLPQTIELGEKLGPPAGLIFRVVGGAGGHQLYIGVSGQQFL